MAVRVAINGFGRIGRAIMRITEERNDCEIVALNEIDPNVENAVYLLCDQINSDSWW